jgi:pseudaminic acid biosynthesis-associated methylase
MGMSMTELWAGDFGNDYTKRNVTDNGARAQIWRMLLPRYCESVLEVGANIGLNLDAIAQFSGCELYACEPNDLARYELYASDLMPLDHIKSDYADKLSFPDEVADLVFTMGVLIHIPTDKLLPSMREVHRVAKRWIICAEYFAPAEEMVPYRGTKDTLWRRDYGSLWLDNFHDLHCQSTLFSWKRMTGLDNLTFWVFEKGPQRH